MGFARKLVLGVFYMALLAGMAGECEGKRFPTDVPKEIQDRIIGLEEAVGLNLELGVLTRPYSDHTLKLLLDAAEARHLYRFFRAHQADRRGMNWEFMHWIVAQISKIDDPAAVEILREIWKSPSYDGSYRMAAQERLVMLGKIGPEGRTMDVLY